MGCWLLLWYRTLNLKPLNPETPKPKPLNLKPREGAETHNAGDDPKPDPPCG